MLPREQPRVAVEADRPGGPAALEKGAREGLLEKEVCSELQEEEQQAGSIRARNQPACSAHCTGARMPPSQAGSREGKRFNLLKWHFSSRGILSSGQG